MTYEAPVAFWNCPQHPGHAKSLYDTPEALWTEAAKYFSWVDQHPLKEMAVFHHKGIITKTMVTKARPYTVEGMCSFMGISSNTYRKLIKARPGYEEVTSFIDQIIYTQKFEGAAAGFFNATIISRDLGLVEKSELSGRNGGPLQLISSDMTPQEAAEAYAATLQGDGS